jgi:hypothetical protein
MRQRERRERERKRGGGCMYSIREVEVFAFVEETAERGEIPSQRCQVQLAHPNPRSKI